MKLDQKIVLHGFLIWLIPFAISFLIWPFHESNRPLFESIMPIVVVTAVVFFSYRYFKEVKKDFISTGTKLGVVWYLISLTIDLLMFSWGPIKMNLGEYFADIGLTYLIIPVVTIGSGYLLKNKQKNLANF